MQFAVEKLTRQDLIKAGLIGIIVALVFAIFHFQGNTTDVRMFSRSALVWMISRWNDAFSTAADYSYAWLIPFGAIWLLWQKRGELVAAPKSTSYAGLAVVVFALLLHWLGAKAQQTRLSLIGLDLLLWGIPYYLCGRHVARLILFPCAFLMLCVPLNFLDSLTFPLRIFATTVSTGLLNGLGIAVQRSGSAIYSTVEGLFQLDVADPCSGIRSIMAMAAMAAIYSHLTQKTLFKQWLLFLLSLPIPVIGNIARIISIAMAYQVFGPEMGERVHEASGYIVFVVDTLCMIALGQALRLNFSEVRERWKQELLSPTLS
jgi:exosortase